MKLVVKNVICEINERQSKIEEMLVTQMLDNMKKDRKITVGEKNESINCM